MEHRIIDLHVHSTESDGTLTPTEIVSAAKAAGLSAFALTDHDTAAGVSKAAPAAAHQSRRWKRSPYRRSLH